MPSKKKSGKKKPSKDSGPENAEVNATVDEQDTSIEENKGLDNGEEAEVEEEETEISRDSNSSVVDTQDENSTPRPVEPEAKPTPDPNPVAKSPQPESPLKSGVNPPVSPSGNKNMKVWDDVPVISTDKVNALMLSASAHKWEVVVTLHEPGKPVTATLTSRVSPKQAKLVMTELRTRMRPPYNVDDSSLRSKYMKRLQGEEAPTLSAVLVAGMRELAALEEDDLQDSNVNPTIKAREIVVEVMCQTDFKTQVAFRMKDAVTAVQATALTSALRRLNNLQKSAVSTHDPVSSTLASALIAGLLTWDRDL